MFLKYVLLISLLYSSNISVAFNDSSNNTIRNSTEEQIITDSKTDILTELRYFGNL